MPTETAANSQDETPPAVPGPEPAKPSAAVKTATPASATNTVKTAKAAKQPLPPPATIPKVSLSDELRATCLVSIGDLLPDTELTSLDGSKAALKSLYGDALTVVFFWTAGTTPHAQQAIAECSATCKRTFSNRTPRNS